MFKNVASQKVTFFAFDYSTGAPKTGDAANLTAYVSKDDGAVTVLGDTSAAELDATNAKGLYSFDLTQSETNGDKLVFSCKSSTANVSVVPVVLYTTPASFTSLAVGNLDAAVSSRMATYAQPTGFLAATFPGTVASPTNITAGTITTVTNLTNAPTAGDLTAAMKASVNAEADAAIETYHLDHLLAATYDPASKPGAADALLNELVESDAGVARYTANALEQAPTGGSAPTAAAVADAVWDEARADHVAAGSFGENVNAAVVSEGITQFSFAAGAITGLAFEDAALTAAKFGTGFIQGVSFAAGAITATAIAANAIGASELAADAVVEIQAGLSTLDAAAVRAAVGLASADLDTQLGNLPTNAELTAALAAADDAVLTAIAALNNPSTAQIATAVLTTAMTEAYRSAGATATLAQFAYEVIAHLGDSGISGTTKTLRKLDGTAAKTFTLDSATTPTSITEAT